MPTPTHTTRPPWAVQEGLLLSITVFCILSISILILTWWVAMKFFGWPGGGLLGLWNWGRWAFSTWLAPDRVARIAAVAPELANNTYNLARLSLPSSILFSSYFAIWAGVWIARPAPAETQLAGRRLSYDPQDAKQEMALEFKKRSAAGVLIHPYVRISEDRETKHILVTGMTGSGKTVFLYPLIQQAIQRGDKILIFCNKGDFTSCLVGQNGREPIIMAPWDSRATAWDVAADCAGPAAAQTLAAKIIKESKSGPEWTNGARAILTASILWLQKTNPGNWDFQDLLIQSSVGHDELKEMILETMPEQFQLVETKSKTLASYRSIVSSATANIRFMAQGWKNKKKFSFNRWLLDENSWEAQEGRLVIMQGNEEFEELQKAYIQSIIGALSALVNSPRLPESKTRKVWLILDESPQLGKVPEIAKFIEIGRSKGARVILGGQCISQWKEIYGQHVTESWVSMIGTHFIGRCDGVETPKWLAEKIGKRKIRKYRISYNQASMNEAPQISHHWDEIEEPIVRPEELSTWLGVQKHGCRGILMTGGDTVYLLEWPFPKPKEVRPALCLAAWAEGGAEESEMEPDRQAVEEQPAPGPGPEPALAASPKRETGIASPKPKIQSPENREESPVAEEMATEGGAAGAGQILDMAIPGAGVLVETAENLTQTAEIIKEIGPGRAPTQKITEKPAIAQTVEDDWLALADEPEAEFEE